MSDILILFKINHKTFLHMHTSIGYLEPLVFVFQLPNMAC